MSASLRPMTAAEFLEWEEQQELRYEFDGVTVEAMVGGTAGHASIKHNLAVALDPYLGDGPSKFVGSGVKLSFCGRFRYPDAMVVCVPIARKATFVTQPTVIFEVLSDSTAVKDRTVKRDEYRSIPALRRYVMFEQDRIAATILTREGVAWVETHLVGPDALLDMPEIGVDGINLARLYRGVELDDTGTK